MKNKKSKSRIDNAAAMIKNTYQMHRGMVSIQEEYTKDLNDVLDKFNKSENSTNASEKNPDSNIPTSVSSVQEPQQKKKEKTKRYKKLEKNIAPPVIKVDHPDWIKDLYRNIMRKCHPDIVNAMELQESEKNYRIDISSQVIELFEKKEYKDILFLGATVEVYTEKLNTNLQVKMLNELFSDIAKKIDGIQNSVSWLWGINWDNVETRVRIIQSIMLKKGFQQPERQEIIAKIIEHDLE